MTDQNNQTHLPRVWRKLAKKALHNPDPRNLANEVANTSEETADLFASEYTPESELGLVINPPGPGPGNPA